jgi:hypothetical protein
MKRVCAHPGCTTVLARGNPGPYCFAHEPEPGLSYCGKHFHICICCGDLKELRRPHPGRVICSECEKAMKEGTIAV